MLTGIISDIHEDIIRLEAALKLFEEQNVDDIICLGDIVGYSVPFYGYLSTRDANRCVELIRKNCSVVVIGNHDLFATKRLPSKCADFNFPMDWYQRSFAERKKLSNGKIYLYEDHELPTLLDDENLIWLSELPEYVIKSYTTHNVMISHYAAPDITGCSSTEVKNFEQILNHFEFMTTKNCIYGFSGNDHIPGMKIFSDGTVNNYDFEKVILGKQPCWITGPTVSMGTVANGVMIYDSVCRNLETFALNSPIHAVPSSI